MRVEGKIRKKLVACGCFVLHRTSSMSSLAFIFLILEAPTAAERALNMYRIASVSGTVSRKVVTVE